MKPLEGIGWALASLVALNVVTVVVATLWPEVRSDIVTLGGVASVVYLGSAALVLGLSKAPGAASEMLGIRPTQSGLLWVGVGLGLTLKLPAEHLAAVVEELYPTPPAQLAARAALFQTEGVAQLVGLSLVVCVLGPLAEEVFFRGALYGRMAMRSVKTAALVTSLCFVVVHGNPRHWLALLLIAGALGWLRASSGSLLPCLGLHVAFNALGVLLDEMGYLSMSSSYQPDYGQIALSWLGSLALVAVGYWLSGAELAQAAREEDRR